MSAMEKDPAFPCMYGNEDIVRWWDLFSFKCMLIFLTVTLIITLGDIAMYGDILFLITRKDRDL